MKKQKLFEVLQRIQPLSDVFQEAIEEALTELSLPKGYFLMEAPRVAEYIYFIESGFAQAYYYEDGEKLTSAYWKSGQFVVSFQSFTEQKPSTEYIQLMTHSKVWCLSYESMNRLLEEHAEGRQLYRQMLHAHVIRSQKHVRDMQRLKAEDRFQNLIRTFPRIEQLVTQRSIATYLGITSQSLSRMKKGMA